MDRSTIVSYKRRAVTAPHFAVPRGLAGMPLLIVLGLASCEPSGDPAGTTDEPASDPQVIPYPPSSTIEGISFDFSTHRRAAPGSDNFPLTWAADGHQYTGWGDGWGFEGGGMEFKVSLGFSRIEGPADSYRALDVFYGDSTGSREPFDAKTYGMLALGDTLYSWLIFPDPGVEVDRPHWADERLYRSHDDGRSWQPTGVAFGSEERLGVPWFLQFGRGYAGAPDDYVYTYFTEVKSGEWEAQRPGEIALARVPIGTVEDRGRYEFFGGLDAGGDPIWTEDVSARRPVFRDPNGLMRNSTVYNPGLDRYLMVVNHTARALGNIGIFDAPEPWGPWTTVLYECGWGDGYLHLNTYYWNFSPKWWSEDGQQFVMAFSGKKENDSWNTIEGEFSFREGDLVESYRSAEAGQDCPPEG